MQAATAAAPASGETRAPSIESLTRIAHSVLDHFGYEMTRSHISRLVRRYMANVQGWSFFDYFANAIALDSDQRRQALLNPDVARAISYADPTGEAATGNVYRTRGY